MTRANDGWGEEYGPRDQQFDHHDQLSQRLYYANIVGQTLTGDHFTSLEIIFVMGIQNATILVRGNHFSHWQPFWSLATMSVMGIQNTTI